MKNSGTSLGTEYVLLQDNFSMNFSYSNMNDNPRFIGDINGDGLMDMVGVKSDGVFVAKGSKSCSHSTRDLNNGCACRSGYYDAGDG